MSGSVKILNVQMSPPRPSTPSIPRPGAPADVVDCSITLQNTSKHDTFHVICNLRGADFDPTTHTLFLRLTGGESGNNDLLHPLVPDVLAIAPGASSVVTLTIPRILRKPTPAVHVSLDPRPPPDKEYAQESASARGGPDSPPASEADISEALVIKCAVGYGTTPAVEPIEDGDRIIVHFDQEWEKIVEAVFRVKK
jgi:hypothetical protein